jgi:hypothetical protein
MTSATPVAISALPRGHEFSPATFAISRAQAAAYLDAIGDANDYGANVPPLAAVAFGLAALLEQTSLPDGSLHTSQEVEHAAPVQTDTSLTMKARVAQRSERQGFVISVIEFEIASSAASAIRARTTIMAPAGGGGV